MTDGRTDGGDCNIPDAFLKKRGDNNRTISITLKGYSAHRNGCVVVFH